MKLTFTPAELAGYFNGTIKHKAYNETVKITQECRHHADGLYPKEMIEERRPSEGAKVKEYRQKIWKPITKKDWNKVVTELNKIRRSSDWNIKYNADAVPALIVEEETLQSYCEKNYPMEMGSITNWVFSILLPLYLKDPNCIIAIMPIAKDITDVLSYVRPYAYTFSSVNVIDFVQNDYAVLKSTDKAIHIDEAGIKRYGDIYYIITTMQIIRFEDLKGDKKYTQTWVYNHNIGELPAFRPKGLVSNVYDETFVYKSRFDGMLASLDEALREYSDLQAEVVQHIFSEKWEVVTDDCPTCKGRGVLKGAGFLAGEVKCHTCDGTGAKQRGPYTTLQIRQPMAAEAPMPTPPMGYVQKDVDIVKVQDERVKNHCYEALSAINMEFLSTSPLNQSGKAKEVDKDALNNFVSAIAEDIVATMDRTYYFTNEYRYLLVVPNKTDRRAMLPYIAVPEKFDILSNSYLEDQIAKQKENKGNPFIIVAMEEDYVNKKFIADDSIRERVLLSIKLDPLAGVSEDDKMARLGNDGITKETYIISSNIREFIDRAIDEKGDVFFTMKSKEQKALMHEYAKGQIEAVSAKAKVFKLSGFTETNNPGESQKDNQIAAMNTGG